jgi:hypothetical protein
MTMTESNNRPPANAPYAPGEVILMNFYNALEDRNSRGKVRPAVLVERQGGQWLAVGLTTKSTYANGAPRTPVPNYQSVGLKGPGFLWTGKLDHVSALDIVAHLGWIDRDLIEAIGSVGYLSEEHHRELEAAADRYQGARAE